MNKVVAIADVAAVFYGVNPSRLPNDQGLADVPIISIKDISDDGTVAPPEQLATAKFPGPSYDQQRLREGDVLVSIRGTLLKTAIVGPSHVGAFASSNLAILRPKPQVLPETLVAALASPVVRNQLLGESTGAVIQGLRMDTLKKARFGLPPMEIQKDLALLLRGAEEQYRLAVRMATTRREMAYDVISARLEAI